MRSAARARPRWHRVLRSILTSRREAPSIELRGTSVRPSVMLRISAASSALTRSSSSTRASSPPSPLSSAAIAWHPLPLDLPLDAAVAAFPPASLDRIVAPGPHQRFRTDAVSGERSGITIPNRPVLAQAPVELPVGVGGGLGVVEDSRARRAADAESGRGCRRPSSTSVVAHHPVSEVRAPGAPSVGGPVGPDEPQPAGDVGELRLAAEDSSARSRNCGLEEVVGVEHHQVLALGAAGPRGCGRSPRRR